MKCECIIPSAIQDDAQGITCCSLCGFVIEKTMLKVEAQFDPSQRLVGKMHNQLLGGFRSLVARDSKQIRLQQACKLLEGVASKLELNNQVIESAQRIFKMAQEKYFTQGRNLTIVAAACLYIACRKQKTPHLMIDFSDVIKRNMYTLASYYIKLLRLLDMEVPMIDPSIFIHRFCSKLEFDSAQNKVAKTALRLMQSMSREWMGTGRRPNGLCGAAILIAARYHGFRRTTAQIVKVVHVCDETIRKRLDEFKSSSVGKLTYKEFQEKEKELWGPPKVIREICRADLNVEDEKEVEEMMKTKAIEIEGQIGEALGEEKVEWIEEVKQEEQKEPILAIKNDEGSSSEDEELKQIMLTDEERKLKTLLWNSLNREWIQEQKEKLRAKRQQQKRQKMRPKRKQRTSKKTLSLLYQQTQSPAESIKISQKLGKIDPGFVDSLFEKKA